MLMLHINVDCCLPSHTHRMVQSIFVKNPEQFRSCSSETHQTESGQHCIPQNKQALEPKSGTVPHHSAQTEHQRCINSAVVKSVCPIICHPLPCPFVVEILFEVEHVRIVGRLGVSQQSHHDYRQRLGIIKCKQKVN